MFWDWIRFFWMMLILSALVACGVPESRVDPTLVPVQEPTQSPEATSSPEPTLTPLPTETPEPTATTESVLQPDLSANFDMETCSQEPYWGKPSLVSFSSEVIPDGGHLTALAGKLNKEFYNQIQVPAGFDIDPILYGAWSHFSQQISAPVDANGNPIPLEVNIGPTGQEYVYQICLDPSSYGTTPNGVSLMTPDIIPQTIIQGHCENEYGVNKIKPEFVLFNRDLRQNSDPSVTVTITEPTTVSEFLKDHEAAECYSIHRESSNLNVFNDPGWRGNYDKATEAQMIAASFINQGATPLPLQFEEGGTPTRMMNPNLPVNAIIPEGEYFFYPKIDIDIPCSEEPFALIPPIPDGNSCYHIFGEMVLDGIKNDGSTVRHLGIDYRITGNIFAPAAGSVDYVGSEYGGIILIDNGCYMDAEGNKWDYVTVLGHSPAVPGIEKGVAVNQGDLVAKTAQYDEVELQVYQFPANINDVDYKPTSRPEKFAVDPALFLPPFQCNAQ